MSENVFAGTEPEAAVLQPAMSAAGGSVTRPIVTDPMEFGFQREPDSFRMRLFIAVAGVALFVIALTGLPNLTDNEHRMGAYVMDAVQNGHWFVQRDFMGELSSKPPMLTWLSALGTFGTGQINRFALYWPTAAATIATALVLLAWGRRYFGWEAGFLAAFVYLLSPAGMHSMTTVRYDGLLALAATLAAWAAFRAWTLKRSWTWFWLAAAWGVLIKGPIIFLVGAGGLLAFFWEKRSGHQPKISGSHWRGVLLFLGLCLGWLALAYAEVGPSVIQKMFGRELVGHVTGAEKHETMLVGFYEPPQNFIVQFIPWSLAACVAFWRVWWRPAADADDRRLERFLTCWFFAGFIVFCIAAHQRSRLIWPLLPAAALLAGRELARWLKPQALLRYATVVAIVALVGFYYHQHWLLSHNRRVKETLGMKELASRTQSIFGKQFPLVHVDAPFAFQFYYESAEPLVSLDHAAELLSGDYPAFVSIKNYEQLISRLGTNASVYEIARWPAQGEPALRIVGNRLAPEPDRLATVQGPFLVQVEQMRLVKTRHDEFTFQPTGLNGKICIQNQSSTAQTAGVLVDAAGWLASAAHERRVLQPHETWTIPVKSHAMARED